MYEKGTGIQRSELEAFNWFTKAAFQGHERALVILGSGKWDAYMQKKPAERQATPEQVPAGAVLADETGKTDQELKYLAKAEQGNVDAQYNLGIMYYHGEGAARNHDEALRWFHLAAEQDDADAQYNLGLMYGKGEGTKKDQRTSVEWFRKAAEKGHADAKEILEKMFG
jgi:TPR repeat protein